MKRVLYLILFVVVLFVGLTFSLKNNQAVEVHYYFGLNWSGPLSMALLVTLIAGAVLGVLASLVMVFRIQWKLAQARGRIRKMEQEIMNLRALPIRDAV